jgi:PQQ-dependent dehydrogenase (s-GDH family)
MRKLLLSILVCVCAYHAQSQSCSGLGSINFQRWNNINGSAVSNLTSSPNYPNNPSQTGTLTSLELPQNIGNNIGVRIHGWVCAPATGNYTFWIASDAAAELWLSTTSDPAQKIRIAFNAASTNYRQWTKFATQKSASIALTAGNKYYIEVLFKEATGQDNCSVGWARPGQSTAAPSEVVPGSQLSTTAVSDPVPPSAPNNLNASYITNTTFQLNWAASSDNVGVTGYDVYRNGIKINANNIIGTSYSVNGLLPNTAYNMTVVARDEAGNQSPLSDAAPVTTLSPTPAAEPFAMRTVIGSQNMPHDLVYGPDDNLWFTERFAGTVSFVNPSSGAKTIVLTLGSLMVRVGGQDGLMGLALHPEFLTGKPYVYIMYTYQSLSATERRMRIARYTYNSTSQTLGAAVTILENIPGSNDHNSARLAIGPDLKLYVTIGDMGAGQFDNINRTNNAQNLNILEGKILRLNTESISGSWIPTDNPHANGVYTFGHRNAQGLVWGNVNGTNILYSTEHGPFSDDEVNVIETGRNYGWPNVIGFCDGNYNSKTTGGYAIVNEQANCNALNAKEPMRTIFPSNNPPGGGDFFTWPSMGVSGTEFYGSNAIPGWQNSLLIATLKGGRLVRYQLSGDGQSIISDTINYFRGQGRFRDVVVSPDGTKIYIACDSEGSTSGPTGNVTTTPPNPGSILEFTYTGPAQRRNNTPVTNFVLNNNNSLTNKTIDVYPNPAVDFIVVYNHSNESGRTAMLFDVNGRLVIQQPLLQTASRMNVTRLTPGTYVLRVMDGGKNVLRTEKVVIVR